MPVSDPTYIRFSLGDYFRPGTHKVAMSVPELVSATNAFSTKNRPGCTPKLTKSNPKELTLQYQVTCDLKTSDPAGHTVKVQFDLSAVKDEATAKNLDVKVSCSCKAFLYWGAQWALHMRDSLEGEPRPLLTAPTERLDLRKQFVICKHCAAVFERILPSVQHNITKILRQQDIDKRKPLVAPTKERLEQQQEQMRKRLELRKKRDKQNKRLQEEMLRGLRLREQELVKNVVIRDEPSTEEEKERVPLLTPAEIALPEPQPPTPPPPAPVVQEAVAQPVAPQPVAPVPPSPPVEKNDVVKRQPTVPAVKPPMKDVPQKMPGMGTHDRDALQRLMREEQRRQQQQMSQRLKNNPGRRR